MSLPIWTPDALSSELRAWTGPCWRLVEAQHYVSTLKLVDTLAEQALLEDILEASKPSIPLECRHLDYLLATPFRYGAVYPHGSRFRRAGRTAGVFYGAEHADTAVAEMVFYRLLFFSDSPATPLPDNAAEYTAFRVTLNTSATLDLTQPALDADAALWTHPTDYAACQALADAGREIGTELIRFQSVRDPKGGANLAVMSCRAFATPAPEERQTWRIRLNESGAQALCAFPATGLEFSRADFARDPRRV